MNSIDRCKEYIQDSIINRLERMMGNDIDVTRGGFELPTNSKTAYAWKIPKSFEVSGLIVSILLLPSFRVPVDGDLVQSFGLA